MFSLSWSNLFFLWLQSFQETPHTDQTDEKEKLEPKIAAESVKSVLEELEVGETSVTGGIGALVVQTPWSNVGFETLNLPVVIISQIKEPQWNILNSSLSHIDHIKTQVQTLLLGKHEQHYQPSQ